MLLRRAAQGNDTSAPDSTTSLKGNQSLPLRSPTRRPNSTVSFQRVLFIFLLIIGTATLIFTVSSTIQYNNRSSTTTASSILKNSIIKHPLQKKKILPKRTFAPPMTTTTTAAPTQPPTTTTAAPTKPRDIVHGFDEAQKYLRDWDKNKSSTESTLVICFISEMKKDNDTMYWCPDCQDAAPVIAEVYDKSDESVKLLEIRVGTPTFWKDKMNAFRQNPLFYVDFIPSLLRYDGQNKTSHLLSKEACLDFDMVSHVIPGPTSSPALHSGAIETVRSYDAMIERINVHDFKSTRLFLHFISGVMPENSRPWCPYCDRAEIPINSAFNHSSSSSGNSVLLKVIVAETYEDWQHPENDFRSVKGINGVPSLAFARSSGSGLVKDGKEPHDFLFYNDVFTNQKPIRRFFHSISVENSNGNNIYTVQGYDDAVAFMTEWDITVDGPLFLLFMSDKEGDDSQYWCPDCVEAESVIKQEFRNKTKDQRRSLLEIRVGDRKDWKDMKNKFRNVFKISSIPSLLTLDDNTGIATKNLLSGGIITSQPLLSWVFSHAKDAESIKYVGGYPKFTLALDAHDYKTKSLFVWFVSGNDVNTNRPWCPDCDNVDAIITYAFLKNMDDSVLLKVNVADTYGEWKDSNNRFRTQKLFAPLSEIPALYRVTRAINEKSDKTNPLVFESYSDKMVELSSVDQLSQFFGSEKNN